VLDPDVKRLAVHVEDHPLDYADFEGEIPKGEYGAGQVEIWDKGTWTSLKGDPRAQIRKGKLEFSLQGGKLNGSFVLVRMKGDDDKNWLLKKMHEEGETPHGPAKGARDAPMPRAIKLQLCKKSKSPPKGEGWVHELKWDGYRVLAYVRTGSVRLVSRGGKDLDIPHLEKALDGLPDCILDGEVVAVDKEGRTSFKLVHAAIAGGQTRGLAFYVFDAPYAEGLDLRGAALLDRKAVCRRLVERAGVESVRYSEHSSVPGAELFEQACKSRLEGIVSKRKGGRYGAGRTGAWVKCRCLGRLSGVIGGYTLHSRNGQAVGAVVVGVPNDGELLYAGKVGTGFSERQRRDLFGALHGTEVKSRPFRDVPSDADTRGVRWVEPRVKAEVEFLEWSEGGVMRQPALVGTELETVGRRDSATKTDMKLTHPDRVVDEKSRTTKAEVAEYYALAAKRLLSYAGERPLAIIRCPDGIAGSCFFQKHWMQGLDKSVGRVDTGEDKEYMFVKDARGVLALVQFGMLELHTWGSKVGDLERPDVLVFDLDPDEGLGWKDVLSAAAQVRGVLEGAGLACWPRVTGGKGLHIVVPIKPELEWDVVKAFCQRTARAMERAEPKRFVSVASKAKRHGRIFLDYLRNGRGSTAASSYSLRARPGLPVCVPVSWDEVPSLRSAAEWTIADVRERIEGPDPWSGFAKSRRSLRRLLG
jgi:bifunctional non-homologous end joining protein LigD